MAVERRWQRRYPHAELDLGSATDLVGQPVRKLELLSGGLRNTNYRLQLEGKTGHWSPNALEQRNFARARIGIGRVQLRYSTRMGAEYTSGFIDGYRAAGGSVPPDVHDLTRLIDLVSLWTFLERAEVDAVIVPDIQPVLEETLQAFQR